MLKPAVCGSIAEAFSRTSGLLSAVSLSVLLLSVVLLAAVFLAAIFLVAGVANIGLRISIEWRTPCRIAKAVSPKADATRLPACSSCTPMMYSVLSALSPEAVPTINRCIAMLSSG